LEEDSTTIGLPESVTAILGWLIGDQRDEDVVKHFPDLAPFFEAKGQAEKAA
jgi:hypothetical protein